MRAALLAAVGGAVYGALTVIAGVGAIPWLVVLVIVSRRHHVRALLLPAVGFFVGFGVVLLVLVVPTTLSCQRPSCIAAPWNDDLAWAAIGVAVAGVVFGVARLVMFLADFARRNRRARAG